MEREYNIFYCGEGIWKASDSRTWMEKAGSDPNGIRIMMEKDQIYPIYVSNVYFGAGNILKQDLLSLGGDVVLHKFFVNAKKEYGDILLLGTAKHYRLLQTKMYAQHWGLKELSEDLKIIMENMIFYRESDMLTGIEETENGIPFSPGISVEEAMKKLPLLRARKSGFKTLYVLDFENYKKYFYPALSRGYLITEKND